MDSVSKSEINSKYVKYRYDLEDVAKLAFFTEGFCISAGPVATILINNLKTEAHASVFKLII